MVPVPTASRPTLFELDHLVERLAAGEVRERTAVSEARQKVSAADYTALAARLESVVSALRGI